MPRRMPFAASQSQLGATISPSVSPTILSAKQVRQILAHAARLTKRKNRVDQAQALWPRCWRCRSLLVRCACPVADLELWYR